MYFWKFSGSWIFKYFHFFQQSFIDFSRIFGWTPSPTTLHIVLPIGISFYIFLSISYILDIRNQKMKACQNGLDFALYISFFPQLLSGPIERATHLLPQIQRNRVVTAEMFYRGLYLIVFGIIQKNCCIRWCEPNGPTNF